MNPRTLDAAMRAALPPVAAAALQLARQFDPTVDPAAAWLAAVCNPTASPSHLALILRAQARRDRRLGGAHGPGRATSLTGSAGEDLNIPAPQHEDQECDDAERAAAELWARADTAVLAVHSHCTRRRAQQIRARALSAIAQGQMALELEGGAA